MRAKTNGIIIIVVKKIDGDKPTTWVYLEQLYGSCISLFPDGNYDRI